MKASVHERAREMIALSGAEDISGGQQVWLQGHLQECAACRDYSEASRGAVRALRSLPWAAQSGLVQATQMRVRSRAFELRQQQERVWLVGLSSVAVGLCAAITTPLFWRAFEWAGGLAGVSNWVWQAGFSFSWITPALVVGALLLARGTHWTSSEGKPRL